MLLYSLLFNIFQGYKQDNFESMTEWLIDRIIYLMDKLFSKYLIPVLKFILFSISCYCQFR